MLSFIGCLEDTLCKWKVGLYFMLLHFEILRSDSVLSFILLKGAAIAEKISGNI